MTTYNTALVTGPIQDGYLLPSEYAAFSQITLGSIVHTHIIFQSATDSANVMAINTTVELSPQSTGNAITVQLASNVTIRLVTPSSQRTHDILLLVNGNEVGIHQFTANTWIYRGKVVSTQLQSSSISTALSSGFSSNLSFTGLTAQVTKVDEVPDELLPYKVYADRVTGIIYFPYVNATSYQFPFSVASIHNPQLVSTLIDEQIIVISPCGYAQTDTLPRSTDYVFFTYSALTSVSVKQPVSIYSSSLALLAQSSMLPTTRVIDYSMISGLTDIAYQLASGYYRGGNNTWDVLLSDQGLITTRLVRQVTPASIYPSALVDLTVCQLSPNPKTSNLFVYIGKETSIQGTDIFFRLELTSFNSKRISNIRLAAGEALFCSTSSEINYTYRYSMLARSF